MQLPEARLVPWVRWGLVGVLSGLLRGDWGAWAQKAFSCQILPLHKGEHFGSGFQAQETTSKAAVPREQEAAQTIFALWRAEG